MTTQVRDFNFPEGASNRDKVLIVLDYPRMFVRWCRERVGIAPSSYARSCGDCIVEQYLKDVTGEQTCIDHPRIFLCGPKPGYIVTPTWVQRVIEYVDDKNVVATYNSVANMLMGALERNEIA